MPLIATVTAMTAQPEITQRDLRNKSREIMDAVEAGQSFSLDAFRADQDAATAPEMDQPYAR